jgi:hypothetical protein
VHGVPGSDGADGIDGTSPEIEVDGTNIRFKNSDGSWTDWISTGGTGAPGTDGTDGWSPTVDYDSNLNRIRFTESESTYSDWMYLRAGVNGVDGEDGQDGDSAIPEFDSEHSLVRFHYGSQVTEWYPVKSNHLHVSEYKISNYRIEQAIKRVMRSDEMKELFQGLPGRRGPISDVDIDQTNFRFRFQDDSEDGWTDWIQLQQGETGQTGAPGADGVDGGDMEVVDYGNGFIAFRNTRTNQVSLPITLPVGPQGDKGDKGDDGEPCDSEVSGVSVRFTDKYGYWGPWITAPTGPKGDKGDPGDDGEDGAIINNYYCQRV